MTDLVKQAQAQKPKAQLVSDRISAVFVPVVLGLAVLAFVLGYGVLEFGLKASLLNAIAVLVISCPCAMGLAVPTAVVVGLGRAARQGVWVKSAQVLDAIRSLRTVVFDKTGTLTTGRFSFQKMELAPGYTQEIILQHLLALEEHSQHPLAVSIRHIWAQLPKLAQFEYVTETPDFGLEGQTPSGEHWQAGRAPSSHPTAPEAWLSATVWLWHQQTPVAALWLQDEVRPEAAATVRKLQQQGLTVVMLSGDSASRCWPIAQQLGIQTVYAAQNPAQKLEVLSQLKAQGATLMVGDGINDAPALAAATVGVTLGGVTQLTAQAAQVVLVKPDLSKIVWLVKMGRATVGTIHQNLFWAFFYNVLAIPVAGLGYLSPMVGAATMALSDLVVIGNSLRLRWRKL
jgi:Cu+-exporting ATPase